MELDALVKLAASGNVKDVEETWLQWLEEAAPPESWNPRVAVLEAMAARGNLSDAEALATTALDDLAERFGPPAVIGPASNFLLSLKDSRVLREKTTTLYRAAYPDTAGLDELLAQAGLETGRPPRRAIRTLDVALHLSVGAYLVHRHEDSAARVESIDSGTWRVRLATPGGPAERGPVELADEYEPAEPDDFRVLRQFEPDKFRALLQDDPLAAVAGIVGTNSKGVDSYTIESILVPRFISADEWPKWWTRARQAVRLSPNITIEGRSPYFLKYVPGGQTLEQEIEPRLRKAHDPVKEMSLAEEYVRGCKQRKQEPDMPLLGRARKRIEDRARQRAARTRLVDLTPWLAARRVRELMGDQNADQDLREVVRQSPDPAALILAVTDASLWPMACDALEAVHPQNLRGALERLLPHAPLAVADHLADRLIELGDAAEGFRQMAEQVLRDPVELNEGLLWLWNGPKAEAARVPVPLTTLFTRILQVIADLKHLRDVPVARRKQITANTREALRARKYERFHEMLEQVGPEMASALYTQIGRVHELGSAAGEDLQKFIRRRYPDLRRKPEAPKWLREDVAYVTAEGQRRKQAEIDEILHVKMRENAAAIGRAAERGDLSENSEYRFALEERDFLQARLKQLRTEMDIAQVLTPADVPSDHVGIGSRVQLEHADTHQVVEMTILSGWESDLAKRIYNYRTPLAQTILGARLDDVVELPSFDPPGRYRVKALACALPAPEENGGQAAFSGEIPHAGSA